VLNTGGKHAFAETADVDIMMVVHEAMNLQHGGLPQGLFLVSKNKENLCPILFCTGGEREIFPFLTPVCQQRYIGGEGGGT
jgi:hypothetical protein